MGRIEAALKTLCQALGSKEEHNADEVIIENNLNINGAALAGASVKSICLTVDEIGTVTGGKATLSDGTSITITVETARGEKVK